MFCHLYWFPAATQGKFSYFEIQIFMLLKLESESAMQKTCNRIRIRRFLAGLPSLLKNTLYVHLNPQIKCHYFQVQIRDAGMPLYASITILNFFKTVRFFLKNPSINLFMTNFTYPWKITMYWRNVLGIIFLFYCIVGRYSSWKMLIY